MNNTLRQFCLPVAVLATLGLSACGGSSQDTTAAPQAAGSTSTPASSTPSPTPTPSPSPTTLTKAEFVTKIEALCVDTTTKVDGLPQPSGAEDYAAMGAAVEGTLKLFPQYVKQAEALVAKSGDKATLTAHWLTPEKVDYTAAEPALKKFLADIKAKDRAAVAADAKALDAMPDHSAPIAKFLTGYGLKSCAALEDS
ncbi:MAG: hypothetical protein QOE23_84 [Pseudonocardiales bacterium]|jgi:hypothetical protein|nr:hypothetical protein [Pseudonocardiales bacterium]